jgi:hypothetical protein
MAQHLPTLELPGPEIDDRDRKASSGPSKQAVTSVPDQTEIEPPHVREALRAIVRLLQSRIAVLNAPRGMFK